MCTDINYEKKICAFIDILGFKQYVKESVECNEKVKELYTILNSFRSFFSNFGKLPGKEVTAFSDSIVVSYIYDKRILNIVAIEIRHLIGLLAQHGLLCRGGISCGMLFHKDPIVFGPSMIDAYLLESKQAIYPRVIFDNLIITDNECTAGDIIKDDDGYYFVNYVIPHYNEKMQMLHPDVEVQAALRRIISTDVAEDPSIIKKFAWVEHYINARIGIKFIPVQGTKDVKS